MTNGVFKMVIGVKYHRTVPKIIVLVLKVIHVVDLPILFILLIIMENGLLKNDEWCLIDNTIF